MVDDFPLHLFDHQGDPVLLALDLPLERAHIPRLIAEEMHDLVLKQLALHHPFEVLVGVRLCEGVEGRVAELLGVHDNYRQ